MVKRNENHINKNADYWKNLGRLKVGEQKTHREGFWLRETKKLGPSNNEVCDRIEWHDAKLIAVAKG